MSQEAFSNLGTAITQNQQAAGLFSLLLETFKKAFTFKGRATRKEFWTYVISAYLIQLIVSIFCAIILVVMEKISYDIAQVFGVLLIILQLILNICLIIPGISVSVRRLHDLNLTGFWLWYLSPLGLSIVFMVNLLNLDNSCNAVMEKVTKCCTTWVSWILLPFFWFFGAPLSLLLLYLYKGKEEDNDFGPNPY